MFGDLQEARASSSRRSYTPPSTFHPPSTPDMSTYPGFPGHRSDYRPSDYGHIPYDGFTHHRRSISDPFQTPPGSGSHPGQNVTSDVQQHRRRHSPHRHVAQYTSAPPDPTIFRYQHREDLCQLCTGLQLHRHDELYHRPHTPCYVSRQAPVSRRTPDPWNGFASGAVVPTIPIPPNLPFIHGITNPQPVIPPPPPPQARRNTSTRRARTPPENGSAGQRVMGALRCVGRWLSAYLSGSKRETSSLPRRRTMPAKIPRVFQREHPKTEKASHSGALAEPELQPPIRPFSPLPNLLSPRPPPLPSPSLPPVPALHPFLQHDPINIGPITWDVSREPASILLTPADLSQLLTRPPAIPILDSILIEYATDPPIQHMFINALADFPFAKCLRDPDTAQTHDGPHELELKTLPWPIRVSGSPERQGNLTCLDVFNAIYQNFQQYISRSEHELWTTKRRRLMAAAYHQRRRQTEERWVDPYHVDTPEEEGLMRCDYLGSQVIFRGLEQNIDGEGWTLFLGPPV